MPPLPAAVSSLEDHLGYWLRFVSNQVSQAFAQRLETRGVSVAEWVALRLLYDLEEAPPSLLAEHLGMTRGAVTKLTDRLLTRGLVVRGVAAGDRRFQAIALTADGRALVPDLAGLADANDAAFFGHLSLVERRLLERTLRDMVRRFDLKSLPIS